MQLYRMLQRVSKRIISFLEVGKAYDRAVNEKRQCHLRLQEAYRARRTATGSNGDISVVLLGRPYNVLSEQLNSNIPRIFKNLGIDTFYQDMVSYAPAEVRRIGGLLEELHWKFAARILETAEVIGSQPGVYPVYITSFKCSPNSFALDYFKRIMAYHRTPYLILELDGKTLVFPNWERISCSFLVSVLRHEGIDAHLMNKAIGRFGRASRTTPASASRSTA